MGREIEIDICEYEPGDVPDQVCGYMQDPIDRVCNLLTMIALFNVGTFVMMTAFMTVYFKR